VAKKKPAPKKSPAQPTAKQQDYIHGLTEQVKANLKSGKYKRTKAEIKTLEEGRKNLASKNRELGWEKRRLRAELKKRLPAAAKAAIKDQLEEAEFETSKNRAKSAKIANQVQMGKGKEFFFEVDLSGFHKERWGKKRPVYRISSKQFEKKAPGEIEAQLLRAWKASIHEALKTEKRPKVIAGLKKLLNPVEKNINIAEGKKVTDIPGEKPYPIIVDFDEEEIDLFITGAK